MKKKQHHFVERSFVNQTNKHVLWPPTTVWRCLVAIPRRIALWRRQRLNDKLMAHK